MIYMFPRNHCIYLELLLTLKLLELTLAYEKALHRVYHEIDFGKVWQTSFIQLLFEQRQNSLPLKALSSLFIGDVYRKSRQIAWKVCLRGNSSSAEAGLISFNTPKTFPET